MADSLEGRVVVVIGASSGIGREIAISFAREGAKVMASARRETRLRDLSMEMASAGSPIAIYPADATRPTDMEDLMRETQAKFGPIDTVVYATGDNTPDRSLKRLSPAVWDAMVGVNLNGAYYATYAALPAMRERGRGHLIYIASLSALWPDPSGAAYQAAKRGMLGLAHAVRFEEKENGIRTTVICPGLVETDILLKRPVKVAQETLAKAMRPIDVAEAVLAVARMPQRAAVTELHLWPTLL